jgi:hypothetical protein
MRTAFGYLGLVVLCALVVCVLYVTTQGLKSLGWDPTLAGLWVVPVLVLGYVLTRARP